MEQQVEQQVEQQGNKGARQQGSKGARQQGNKAARRKLLKTMANISTIFQTNLFSGRVALITGGGTGIGLRTAQELAKLGAIVILASRRKEILENAAQLIRSQGGKAFAVQCNIRQPESIEKCIDESLKLAGTIHFLVNNAGGQFPCLAENISRKGWHAVIETNLYGPFFLSQFVFRRVFSQHLPDQHNPQGGVIVNVLANMWNGFPSMSHTGAARAGVDNLTKSLAIEWASAGVRVNSVAPGVIDSSGLETYPEGFKESIRQSKNNNLTSRLGTLEEVAAVIVFLLSPAASFITGQTIRVDGGESIYHPLLPPSPHSNLPPWKDHHLSSTTSHNQHCRL